MSKKIFKHKWLITVSDLDLEIFDEANAILALQILVNDYERSELS